MSPARKVSILIADDHPVVRIGVRNILLGQTDFQVVGEASDGREALEQVRQLRPSILLLDLAMPNLPGLETLRELTGELSETKTVLLTSTIDNRQILEALQLGARGVVLKDAVVNDLIQCIRVVVEGQYWLDRKPVTNLVQVLQNLMAATAAPPPKTFGLTPRELQIVALIAQGCSNKDIASDCGITEETVKRHLKNIFDKLGVSSRLELALYAINHRLIKDLPAD